MKIMLKYPLADVQDEIEYHPFICLLLPFEPKMTIKSKLKEMLSRAASTVERELLDKYPGDMAWLMIGKLSAVIAGLNYNTHKKSIAIYLSPVLEKIFYLDILLEEKISVDAGFNIREVVHKKRQDETYLVMLLTGKESRIYIAKKDGLIRIVTTTARPLGHNDKIAVFTDAEHFRKKVLESFLQHADNTLGIILKAYPMPLFICGTGELLQQFKGVTRFGHAVIEYVDHQVADATVNQIQKIIAPYIHDWGCVKQRYLLKKLQQAESVNRLAMGVKDVWKAAMLHKGSLLLVERNFSCHQLQNNGEEILFNVMESYHPYSYIKNTVDDVIKKVLENGGDVEFIDDELLQKYQHIVLLQPA